MFNSRGFTLIEIILVIVILAIVVPGVIGAVSFMTQSQVNPLATTTAANLARERMEQIIADKRNPLIGFGAILNAAYPAETPVAGQPGYNRSVNIVCVPPANLNQALGDCAVIPTSYKRVEVTVQTAGIGPSVPDVVLQTLLTSF